MKTKVAKGLIVKDKRILLIKRGQTAPYYAKMWYAPGGKVDEGETPEQAVIREVKEETNLNFKPTEVIVEREEELFLVWEFIGEFFGEIKLQEEEVDGYAWFDYEELMKLDMKSENIEVMEKLKERNLL